MLEPRKAFVELSQRVLEGRAAMIEGDYPAAIAAFGRAAELQAMDDEGGDPPVIWYPTRRSLAAAMLASGDAAGARAKILELLEDWPGDGPRGAEGASFLRRVRDGACRVFSTVLTPDYNDAHANHLHLDGAPRSLCATGPSRARLAESAAKAG